MVQLGRIFRDFLTPALVLFLSGVVVYDHMTVDEPTAGPPVINGKALGRRFVPALASTFSDAWTAAANSLEEGKSVAEAQVTLQTKWQDGRISAFSSLVSPEFAKLLKEGAEPTDSNQRAAVAKLWRDFALGLKGGH